MGICARRPGSLASATVLAAVAAAVLFGAQAAVARQVPAPAAKPAVPKAWTAPRTPDGKPDISGHWNDRTITPLERPTALGAKEFYTDQEFAELSAKVLKGDVSDLTARGGRGVGAGANAPEGPDAAPARGRVNVQYDHSLYGFFVNQSPLVPTKRTSLIVGPEGTIPPLLPEAVKRNADRAARNRGHELDSHENLNLETRCILSALEQIPMLPNEEINTHIQIVQGVGYVAIYQELNHDVRVIPTDGRPHPPQNVRQLQGDSVGHWEGDTLVVDTTNFTDRTTWRGSSEKLHLVERFTRTSPDLLIYRFTVEDPTTWARPWTVELPWKKSNELIYEYACQEGNSAVRTILGAARLQEAEAAKKAGQ